MATPTMQTILEAPGGTFPKRVEQAKVTLVASLDGTTPGYAAGDNVHVSGIAQPTYAPSTGLLSISNMRPTSGSSADVISSPSGCVYKLSYRVGGVAQVLYFTVPDSAGTYEIGDYLSTAPSSLSTSIAATSVTVDDDDFPFTAANVQTALDGMVPNGTGAIPTGQPRLETLISAMDAGSQVDIVIIGDSILELSAWGNKLATALAATYNTNLCSRWYHGYSVYGGLTSSTGSQVLNGASGQSLQLTAGQSVTVTPATEAGATCPTTSCTVVYKKSSGAGSILVKRNGSTVTTIDTNNATTSWSNITQSATTTLGSYTWTFEASGGSVVIEGVYFNTGNESAGVRVWQLGTSGYDCSEWSTLTTVGTFVGNLTPDAFVVALGTNDATGTVVADMTTLYNTLDTATSGQGCIVVPYVSASCLAADVALIRTLANTTLGVPSWDHQKLVGSIDSVNDPFGLSSDSLHPDTNLSWALADQAYAVLSGDPIGSAVAAITRSPRAWQITTMTASGAITTTSSVTAGSFATTGSSLGKVTASDSVAGSSALVYNASTDGQAAGGLISSTLANAVFGVAKAGLALGQGGSNLVTSLIYEASSAVLQTASAWKAKHLEATGATGAANSARLIGRTASGAPASGTWSVGDIAIDANGKLYICTSAGTPGTWTGAVASGITSSDITDGTIVNADVSASAAIAGTKVDAATSTVRGTVELATDAEALARADTTVAVTPANLAAAIPLRGRAKSATNYLTIPGVVPYAVSTVTLTAGRRYFMPVYIDYPADIDQLAFEVTTLAAGNARVGIAACNEDLQPTSILYDSGDISVNSTGVKTASPALTDLCGRYLFMFHSDVGPGVRVVRGGGLNPIFDTIIGANAFLTTLYKTMAYAAFDTTNWDTVASATVGLNHFVFCRISDPSS